jgi:hypothetical protein
MKENKMKQETLFISDRRLTGFWTEFTFEQARNGAVTKIMNEYIESLSEGEIFVGISSHHRIDGFNYFIGVFNDNGSEIIPQSNYLVITDFEDAYNVYSDLMQREFQFKEYFDGSVENDLIPIKIEFYEIRNQSFRCMRIELPIT